MFAQAGLSAHIRQTLFNVEIIRSGQRGTALCCDERTFTKCRGPARHLLPEESIHTKRIA